MTKKISVKLSHHAHEVVSKFKAAAQMHGVHLVGDIDSGHFKGKGIEGSYQISDGILAIVILKKPIFLSWSLIEAKVLEFFGHSNPS